MSDCKKQQIAIFIAQVSIDGRSVQTVNARDLHEFLEIGKDFSTWMKDRIEQYGFSENTDYVIVGGLRSPVSGSAKSRQQMVKDYFLTLDMAKELSMVERNVKGKLARQYFIDCERQAKQFIPQNLPEALRLAANLAEEKAFLEAKLQANLPKVQFHDQVTDALNCQTVAEVAKVLGTGEIRLFRWLRQEGFLMNSNHPYQSYLDRGYFRVVEGQFNDKKHGDSHTYTKTLITGKGLTFIQKRYVGEAA